MGRRVVGLVILLVVLISGFLLWKRHNEAQELASGDVHCQGCMTPEEHARFLKENAGETSDGASDHKNKTAREEAATDFEDAAPGNGGAPGSDTTTTGAGPAGSPTRSPGGEPAEVETRQPDPSLADSANAPNTDTISPNPQNGARYTGSGTYQWYRQGNLTWRINTATGRSCIIYATMEEWRKSLVIRHGCGRNA